MENNISTPIEHINEYDQNTIYLIGNLLINLSEWMIETAPCIGENPTGNTGWGNGYENNEEYTLLYNALHNAIVSTKNNITIENIQELYDTLNDFNWNYWIDCYNDCRMHVAFRKYSQDAYNLMYGGELDEETSYLIDECDWDELDAIMYTYIKYCKDNNIIYNIVTKKKKEPKAMSLTLAKKWYKQGGDFKKVVLQYYNENELKN